MAETIRFFLGGHSPRGFASFFGETKMDTDGRRIILKGGPGCGKSTLIKKCAGFLMEKGHRVEWIHCASDPDSLDALIDHDGKLCIVDGTAPHVLEPDFPGAGDEVVDFSECWETEKLRSRSREIRRLTCAISRMHGRASACVSGAGALLAHNRETAQMVLDMEKIRALGRELAAGWPEGTKAKQSVRLLSAVSADGVAFHRETLPMLADVIYEIEDPWGAGAHALLENLRMRALDRKLSVILCPSLLAEKDVWAHLFLPELGVAFTTANRFHKGTWKPWVVRSLPARTWMDMSALEQDEKAMKITENQAAQLVAQAGDFVAQAKKLHDELEAEYASAMDYDMVNALTDRVLAGLTEE